MLHIRTTLGAAVATLMAASCAQAGGVTVQPTVTSSAAAVLAGHTSAPLILRLGGVKGGGLVRIYVADAQGNYTGTSDPRFVAYGAFEASAVPHSATVIVTGVAALRKALKNGALELRFIADHGTITVESAVLDAST